MDDITVIHDCREKLPYRWDFTFHGFQQRSAKLLTGDYTLEGYEDVLIIERKKSTGELSTNLGYKRNLFYEELERMAEYPYKYILFEFSEEDIAKFPVGSGIPARVVANLRMNAGYIQSCLNKIVEKYDVSIIYCGSPANAVSEAINIFHKVINEQGTRRIIY